MPTVLITGANRGIGLELAAQYLTDGWRVIATCRDPGRAEELRALGGAEVVALDVGEHAQIDQVAKAIDRPIDLLISNAVWGKKAPTLADVDYHNFERAMCINAYATLHLARAFVEQLARSEHKTLAAVSSHLGSIGDNTSGGRYAYRVSKAALNMIVRNLAIDLAPREIKVVTLHPGWVQTRLGGADAPLSVTKSVAGVRRLLAKLKPADSGSFFNYDGRELPW